MDNQWILGGLALGLGIGVAAYYLSEDGKGPVRDQGPPLRRDQAIDILKELRKETLSAFVTLASFATSIKEQTGGKIPEADLKELLAQQSNSQPRPSQKPDSPRREEDLREIRHIGKEVPTCSRRCL
jgi:hypothetical protein